MPTSKPGTFLRGIPLILGHANEQGLLQAPHLIEACKAVARYMSWELHTRGWHPIGPNSPQEICFGFIHWLSHGNMFLILWPCRRISGWTSFKSLMDNEKRGKKIFILQKKRAEICVSVFVDSLVV